TASVYYEAPSALDMLCPILSLLLWSGPPPLAEPAEPEPAETQAADPPDLHFHWEVEAPLLLGAGAIWVGTELGIEAIVPASPRWTEATPADLALREALIWRSPVLARQMSEAFTLGVVPLFGLTLTLIDVGSTGQWRRLHEDLFIVFESVAVAGMLNQVIKISAARGRPYTYEVFQGAPEQPLDQRLVDEPDAYLSFPSGHANVAFAFTASFA